MKDFSIATGISQSGTALPAADSPDLILVPATPEERIDSIKLNSVAWKGPLDVNTYIERENHLMAQHLVKDGLTSWILVDRKEPEGRRLILSSCETYKKKALLAYGGQVEDVPTHGVGSVYCRPEFRRQGYARRMLEELSYKLNTWQMEEESRDSSLFTVLFSDIGKNFYAQFGWRPFSSSHIDLRPITREEFDRAPSGANLPPARALFAQDIKDTMCNDEIIRKQHDSLREASLRSPGAKIAISPDFNNFLWHWAREEFYADKLHSHRDPPVIKGAGDDNAKVYCAWNRNFGEKPEENTLFILRWVYDEPTSEAESQKVAEAMASILRRAQLEAHEWNMAVVEFWNPTPLMQKAVAMLDSSAEVVHREKSSIASLRWTGAEQGLGKDVDWLWNEKYTWC